MGVAPQVEAIKKAIGALRLVDITLFTASYSRPVQVDNVVDAMERVKRQIQFVRTQREIDGKASQLLQVLIGLGVRLTGKDGDDPPVYVEIEADFLAEYEIRSEVSDESVKEFASHNSVHNVWPFWRQHVFDIVQRGRLAHIDIPLYSGSPPGSVDLAEKA